MNLNTKYFKARYSFVVILGLLSAVTHAQAPVAKWVATPEETTSFPNQVSPNHTGKLNNIDILWKVEDLIDHPSAWFNGDNSFIAIKNTPELNPKEITVSVWFKLPEGIVFGQKPLALKSAPTHEGAMYQYGLFVSDDATNPKMLAFYLSLGGKMVYNVANNLPMHNGWNKVTATYDGKAIRLYCNGAPQGDPVEASGPIDAYDTPLILGAYGNLDKEAQYCFQGYISEVSVYDTALSVESIEATFKAEEEAYPKAGETAPLSDYASQINTVLEEGKDVWGETLIAEGGATYNSIKDLLRPLFYSTGHKNTELGVHNLLFGEVGGEPPYIIPLADGSRLAANVYQSNEYIEWRVGEEKETFGADLTRLGGPYLYKQYLPALQTTYTDTQGNLFEQESFATHIDGHEGLVAFVKMDITSSSNEAKLTLSIADTLKNRLITDISKGVTLADQQLDAYSWSMPKGKHTLFGMWSPTSALPINTKISEAEYQKAKASMQHYWDTHLATVKRFEVPEEHVMNVQRNLLIQNLIMQWRYSLGSVVYHDSFYQPESSHSVQTLGEYGDIQSYRKGLSLLIDMTKGPGYYINWERGEKLSHSAHYYHLTQDATFIKENTQAYIDICEEFRTQMATDEYGLLSKQRQCGDIPEVAHYMFHQMVGWRGIRDMAEVWKAIGRNDLYDTYRPLADKLKAAMDKGMPSAITEMDDGTLYIPRAFYTGEKAYPSITETRIGSYWNLVMPYAFASGYWPMDGPELGRIVDYMHQHGGMFLGLLRFNYYPTPIGSFRRDGLPGYYTTGYDNVYLPAYIEMIASQDLADRQVLSFYGKLAHGMTRNTFVTGEGATVGARPSEYYRSTYGGPTSSNNVAFLLNLRLMLVRESFNHDTGIPENLYLAHATPREWLEHGKEIVVDKAPTCFGPVSYRITSSVANHTLRVEMDLPTRNAMTETKLKLRLPNPYKIQSVTTQNGDTIRVNPYTGIIDLTGYTGEIKLEVTTNTPAILQKDRLKH